MARKFFTKKKKTVKEQALEQLRKTRAEINKNHPEMLNSLRDKIEAAGGMEKIMFQEEKPPEKTTFQGEMEKQQQPPIPEDHVPVDRAKNLGTILKFLEMSESRDLHDQLKKMITKSLN